MTSLAAPPCDRVAPPTGLPACQWRRRPSSSPRPATLISIGRSTARRSSPIRSRSARYCTAMVSRTRSSPPGCFTTCWRRLRPPAGSSVAGSVLALRGSSNWSQTIHRSAITRNVNASCAIASRMASPKRSAIFAADKISKVRELALLPPWRLYETTTRAKLTHYQASLEMLRRVAGDLALVDRLDAELNRLVSPAITRTHSARAIMTTAHSKRSNQRGRTI